MMKVNAIYNQNCLDTMADMEDGFCDLIVTSPPYDNLRAYKGYSFDFEPIAKELFRVLKEGGVMVWVVNDSTVNGCESLTSFKQAIYFVEQCGFNLHDTMIYKKTGLTFPESNRYYPAFEYMFILSKGKPVTTNLLSDRKNKNAGDIIMGGARQVNGELTKRSGHGTPINEKSIRQNVWEYSTGWMVSSPDEIVFKHGAAFPEQLAKDHIYSWSNEGELVYDPFGGSGTTAKMAHLAKRKWILSEISEEYCRIAEQRIAPYINQQQLF